jgi:hypothetical protein
MAGQNHDRCVFIILSCHDSVDLLHPQKKSCSKCAILRFSTAQRRRDDSRPAGNLFSALIASLRFHCLSVSPLPHPFHNLVGALPRCVLCAFSRLVFPLRPRPSGNAARAKAMSRSACHRTPKWPAGGGSTGFVNGPWFRLGRANRRLDRFGSFGYTDPAKGVCAWVSEVPGRAKGLMKPLPQTPRGQTRDRRKPARRRIPDG